MLCRKTVCYARADSRCVRNDLLGPDPLEDKFYAPGFGSVLEVDENTGERTELIKIVTE